MSEIKAMIVGISGVVLSDAEKAFIIEHKPWAFILFIRNIGSADNLKALTISLRELSGRNDVLFLLIKREEEYNVCFRLWLLAIQRLQHWDNFIKGIKRREFVQHGLCLDFMLLI